ncbi:hypothetical protein O7632_10075 [Solwaraspora sp. WMMD406]|uniref:hypothetical protein n=1 Tax=Solwaraspora sp. WMMD406 TaxID=3016095 RepID=UPI002417A00C|nr:hypothetical protein [Solwaraspora sp. WMMD406]MDG4764448.1 hypothetical protein [Solwaraspora sp. WMMD406]
MSGRQVAWAAGIAVVIAAANSAVINRLQGGWQWWLAAGVLTLVGALVAGWLAGKASESHRRIGAGAVVAGRDLGGRVRTDPSTTAGDEPMPQSGVAPGAVVAGRDITGQADIDTTGGRARSPRQQGPVQ